MHETTYLDELPSMLPTREERIKVYFGDYASGDDRDSALHIANEFAVADRPMQRTGVLIPVAAHQEADSIFHTLREYALQRNCDPFTIFLFLNMPLSELTEDAFERSEAEVARAVTAFPTVDIRTCTMTYAEPIMGAIRRDLWNGVAMLAYREELFTKGGTDVIGINNDIDTMSISPHYISRIQQLYHRLQIKHDKAGWSDAPLTAVGTRVTHGILPSHPNVGKVTAWVDNTYFQAPGHFAYEAGIAIPFSHYAALGGFQETDKTHETSWVYGSERLDRIPYISGAQLITSPRRYIDRLPDHETGKVWTKASFSATDRCRSETIPDISPERVNDVILERLENDVLSYWIEGAIHRTFLDVRDRQSVDLDDPRFGSLFREQVTMRATAQVSKAERFLRSVMKTTVLADILHDSAVANKYVDTALELTLDAIHKHRAKTSYDVEKD